MTRLILLATALMLAVPATASAELVMFRSPSGKIGCAFFRETAGAPEVRCDWKGGGDRAVRVGLHGRARRIHVTDTVLDPDASLLAYGRSKRFHGLRCRSRRTGMTCRSTRSGHGFTVSVEKRVLF
jgi:hypothetical protein